MLSPLPTPIQHHKIGYTNVHNRQVFNLRFTPRSIGAGSSAATEPHRMMFRPSSISQNSPPATWRSYVSSRIMFAAATSSMQAAALRQYIQQHQVSHPSTASSNPRNEILKNSSNAQYWSKLRRYPTRWRPSRRTISTCSEGSSVQAAQAPRHPSQFCRLNPRLTGSKCD